MLPLEDSWTLMLVDKQAQQKIETRKENIAPYGGIQTSRSPSAISRHCRSSYEVARRKLKSSRAKVRFYTGGIDQKSAIYSVSPERYTIFESLLGNLTKAPICNGPKKDQHIFTIHGSHKITTIEELEPDESYVCATLDVFDQLTAKSNESISPQLYTGALYQSKRLNTPSQGLAHRVGTSQQRKSRSQSIFTEEKISQPIADEDSEEYEFVELLKPKLITVMKSGPKPRKSIKILLTKKSTRSFDHVIKGIREFLCPGEQLKKIYSLSGKVVVCLADFYLDDTVFIAYVTEKMDPEDFKIDETECKHVEAYKSSTPSSYGRVTLVSHPAVTPPSRQRPKSLPSSSLTKKSSKYPLIPPLSERAKSTMQLYNNPKPSTPYSNNPATELPALHQKPASRLSRNASNKDLTDMRTFGNNRGLTQTLYSQGGSKELKDNESNKAANLSRTTSVNSPSAVRRESADNQRKVSPTQSNRIEQMSSAFSSRRSSAVTNRNDSPKQEDKKKSSISAANSRYSSAKAHSSLSNYSRKSPLSGNNVAISRVQMGQEEKQPQSDESYDDEFDDGTSSTRSKELQSRSSNGSITVTAEETRTAASPVPSTKSYKTSASTADNYTITQTSDKVTEEKRTESDEEELLKKSSAENTTSGEDSQSEKSEEEDISETPTSGDKDCISLKNAGEEEKIEGSTGDLMTNVAEETKTGLSPSSSEKSVNMQVTDMDHYQPEISSINHDITRSENLVVEEKTTSPTPSEGNLLLHSASENIVQTPSTSEQNQAKPLPVTGEDDSENSTTSQGQKNFHEEEMNSIGIKTSESLDSQNYDATAPEVASERPPSSSKAIDSGALLTETDRESVHPMLDETKDEPAVLADSVNEYSTFPKETAESNDGHSDDSNASSISENVHATENLVSVTSNNGITTAPNDNKNDINVSFSNATIFTENPKITLG